MTNMTTIDHATESEAWLANADDEYTRVPPIRENIRDAYQRAQVHATLALVDAQREANEQARIANLLTLGMYTNADGSRLAQHVVCHPTEGYSLAINDDIKKGLGL